VQGVGPGTVLGGRYTAHRRLAQLRGAERWAARDVPEDRDVAMLCFPSDHPAAPAVLDAARRAAGVGNSRLVTVLDVGSWAGMSYVVEEGLADARSYASLLADGGLPAEEVRRITGEVAVALEAASQRGLHHLGLNPASVLRLRDGSVKLAGVATECALAGTDDLAGAEAARKDTVGIVALAYAGLTSRWPLSSDSAGLARVPHMVGGVPAPSEIAAGVPSDLDQICRVTLNEGSGPETPGEYASDLGSWSPTQVGGVGASTFSPTSRHSRSSSAVPGAAGVAGAAGAVTGAAARMRDNGARPAGRGSGDQSLAHLAASPPLSAGVPPSLGGPGRERPEEMALLHTSDVDDDTPTADSLPAVRRQDIPMSPDESQRERDHSLISGSAGGLSGAGVAGGVGGVGAALSSAGAAAGQAAATIGGRVGSLAKAASDRAAERVAERVADRRAYREAAREIETSRRVSFDQAPFEDGYEAPAPLLPQEAGAPPSRDQSRTVLIIFGGFVLIALMFGIWGVSKIGSGSDVDSILGSDNPTPATAPPTTSSPSETSGSSGSSTSKTSSEDTSEPVAILNVNGYDPNGDGSENNSEAGRVYDEDPNTYWSSEGYFSADLGGLKPGVGLVVDMGQSISPTSVELQLPTASDITLYLGDSPGMEGSTEIGSTSGKSGTVDVDVTAKAKGQYLIVWYTSLSQATDGRYRATLAEITISR
jgi:hypothetical protein